jgi:XTP/dITP diphosphohydrolase
MTIYLATGNPHKAQELREIFNDVENCNKVKNFTELKIILPKEAGVEYNPDETGSTFAENAMIKAKALWTALFRKKQADYTVIADDSGICVDALGGAPGIYSARYGTVTSDSTPILVNGAPKPELTAREKNQLLLSNMENVDDRRCHFTCAMAAYFGPNRFAIAQETLEGELAREERGAGGFGYDPLVYLPEYGKTVAELGEAEKNKISHRAKAARLLAKML